MGHSFQLSGQPISLAEYLLQSLGGPRNWRWQTRMPYISFSLPSRSEIYLKLSATTAQRTLLQIAKTVVEKPIKYQGCEEHLVLSRKLL